MTARALSFLRGYCKWLSHMWQTGHELRSRSNGRRIIFLGCYQCDLVFWRRDA